MIMAHRTRQFVGERLVPVRGTGDAVGMSHGEPGLPRLFTWHGQTYEVLGVLEKWKSTGPCRNGLRRNLPPQALVQDPHASRGGA